MSETVESARFDKTFEHFLVYRACRQSFEYIPYRLVLAVGSSLFDKRLHCRFADVFDTAESETQTIVVFNGKYDVGFIDVGGINLLVVVFNVSEIFGYFVRLGNSVVDYRGEKF